jgi:hypothetical protein
MKLFYLIISKTEIMQTFFSPQVLKKLNLKNIIHIFLTISHYLIK